MAKPAGRGVTREEIRKFTKLGSKMLTEKLKNLEEFNLILSSKQGKKTFYKLNLANQFTEKIIDLCKLENEKLNKLDFEMSIIIREFVRQILEIIFVERIFIFGSLVKSTFHKDSDIDIAIIAKEKLNRGELLLIEDACEKTEKRFKRKIQPHIFYKQEFEILKKKQDKLAEEILRDGIQAV